MKARESAGGPFEQLMGAPVSLPFMLTQTHMTLLAFLGLPSNYSHSAE